MPECNPDTPASVRFVEEAMCRCGHPREAHSDRAVWPACEAVNGITLDRRKNFACDCPGFRP